MKKLLILTLTIVLALVGCGTKPIIYKEGTYEGTAQGHIGPIKVQILTDKYNIKQIKIMEQQETPVIGEIVYKEIPKRVIKANTSKVEVVSGATYTSKGLIKAIGNGLDKAKIK
ncbi:FMN-binding protein [Clostridium algoriphilum]|uniref:FMN-binding protein n=1 Tax=Clostridium algoriphilum TaxID=198347 RepID=UPI001CF4C5EB|nr:FMN-binding protein [Clostridium algoriphilum]MCB2292241.1 FMN-binding protein [Clostridium algoriphilum]